MNPKSVHLDKIIAFLYQYPIQCERTGTYVDYYQIFDI